MRRRFVLLAVAALALGAATLIYRGPGRALVRGHVGDVAATMLVYALLSLAWTARPWVRALTTLALAAAIEVGQLAWHELTRSEPVALVLGSAFDPWDFAAYVLGVVIALGWTRQKPLARPRSGH